MLLFDVAIVCELRSDGGHNDLKQYVFQGLSLNLESLKSVGQLDCVNLKNLLERRDAHCWQLTELNE